MKFFVRALPVFFFGALLIASASGAEAAADWKESVAQGPCPGGACKETCSYDGDSSYSGNMKLRTKFERRADETTVRTFVDFSARYLFWRIRYLIDERDVLDSTTGRLKQLDLNIRYLVNDSVKRQMWDRFRVGWGDAAGQGRMVQAWRIQGKRQEDFKRDHPTYTHHWDPSQFGDDWFLDYDGGSPVRRADMDIPDFPMNMVSPLLMSFFGSRFLDPSVPYDFQLFLGSDKADKTSPNHMVGRAGGGTAKWSSSLVLGDLKSPANRPTELTVDLSSRTLRNVHLWLESDLGSAEATLQLKSCKVEPL